MTGKRSWSTRTKAFMAVALAFLLWAPQGVSTQEIPLVTGHSTFFNGESYDRCLASIAGLLRSRVMWFNDMVLAERYSGKGTFIFVTEKDAPNPTNRTGLYSEGVFYDFVDPNGAHWHVEEAYMIKSGTHDVHGGVDTEGDVLGGGGQVTVDPHVRAGAGQERWYVWIVELAERPIMDQFAPPAGEAYHHDLYNFLVLVDTCKFRNETAENYYPVNHTDGLGPDNGHETGADNHTHDGFYAHLWIGTRPNLVPAGVATSGAMWQSEWATSGEASTYAQRTPGATYNQTSP